MFVVTRILMSGLLNRLHILIDNFITNRRRTQLSVAVNALTQKEREGVFLSYRNFIDKLKPNQRIVLGSFDANYTFEMAAFAEALNYSFIQKEFKRHELEALQYYYFRGEDKDAVNKKFLLNIDDLIKRFKKKCKELEKV